MTFTGKKGKEKLIFFPVFKSSTENMKEIGCFMCHATQLCEEALSYNNQVLIGLVSMQKYSSSITEYLTAEKSEKGQILPSYVPLEGKPVISNHIFLFHLAADFHTTSHTSTFFQKIILQM